MRNMKMNLPDYFLKKEPNEMKSLDFQSGTFNMEATKQHDGTKYSSHSTMIKIRYGKINCSKMNLLHHTCRITALE